MDLLLSNASLILIPPTIDAYKPSVDTDYIQKRKETRGIN